MDQTGRDEGGTAREGGHGGENGVTGETTRILGPCEGRIPVLRLTREVDFTRGSVGQPSGTERRNWLKRDFGRVGRRGVGWGEWVEIKK